VQHHATSNCVAANGCLTPPAWSLRCYLGSRGFKVGTLVELSTESANRTTWALVSFLLPTRSLCIGGVLVCRMRRRAPVPPLASQPARLPGARQGHNYKDSAPL
jgi:hypothetical protein